MTITPWMIDAILVGIAVEFGVGAVWLRRLQRPGLVPAFGWFLLSGAALMLALRIVLAGDGGDGLIAAALLASLISHGLAIASVIRAAP
ncbi:MAG: hypothetical protein AAF253_03590, partial [Pseudomonadota bacterium]